MTDTQNTDNTTDTTEDTQPAGSTANREAAKYRRQLREVEQRAEALEASLASARAQIIKHSTTDYRVGADTFNTDALADANLDTAALFTEDGNLDTEALDAALQQLHTDKPYFFAPPQKLIVPNEGNSPTDVTDLATWEAAFAPK